MAFSKGMPLGTMIRDWVLERLSRERLGTPDMTGRTLNVLYEIHGKLNGLFGSAVKEPQHIEQQDLQSCDMQVEHLRALEHLLTDRLNAIRCQLEEAERSF